MSRNEAPSDVICLLQLFLDYFRSRMLQHRTTRTDTLCIPAKQVPSFEQLQRYDVLRRLFYQIWKFNLPTSKDAMRRMRERVSAIA